MKAPVQENKDELDIEEFRHELNQLLKKIEQIEIKSNSRKGILDEFQEE